jgi:hypothetical protein
MLRWTLGAIGVLMGLWGAWLMLPEVSPSLLIWLGGGVLVHDALVAPLVGVTGLVLARRLGPVWRTPVAVGLVLSAVLALLAFPLIARPSADVENPGLHDQNHPLGLTLALLVVWAGAAAVALARQHWAARPGRT